MLLLAAGIDSLVRPRRAGLRHLAGLWLGTWAVLALFGLFLGICGAIVPAAVLALAGPLLLAVASNAKNAMLGEPLVFSDLALIGAIFRHPQFYLSALAAWQRAAIVLAFVALLAGLAFFSKLDPTMHIAGAGLMLTALAVLAGSIHFALNVGIASVPDLDADVRRYGLIPSLVLYWRRWRASNDPPPAPAVTTPPGCGEAGKDERPELVVVIQCESFADPAELFSAASNLEARATATLSLPGLEAARPDAVQWGNLDVCGFGAYTMRTEYGVLFGRDEPELQFRRYDPFLTALGESSYALPARLAANDRGWRSLFLHPHDMRFYGRDRIMPAAGFAELVGEDCFAAPQPGEGRYVTDASMATEILAQAGTAQGPTLIYAVTIENHGPWSPHDDVTEAGGRGDLVRSYLHFVRNSDAMLSRLREGLRELGRPSLLVFFGDHRPSIPGASVPGGDRHTPYVMLQTNRDGEIVRGDNARRDLTPAGLHRAILDLAIMPHSC
jgi:Phosphoglycerol transferase and related proteins, alkaline phosphatase superfamily